MENLCVKILWCYAVIVMNRRVSDLVQQNFDVEEENAFDKFFL